MNPIRMISPVTSVFLRAILHKEFVGPASDKLLQEFEHSAAGEHRGQEHQSLHRAVAGEDQCRPRADAGQAPTHSEHEAAEDERPVDSALHRQPHRRAEERPGSLPHQRVRARAHRNRARHHQGERGVPRAGQVQETEHFLRVRHPGDDQAESEHEAYKKGSGCIHGAP